jgi:hypothetical protein
MEEDWDHEIDFRVPGFYLMDPFDIRRNCNMALKLDLPKFGGLSSENARQFMADFESYATLKELAQDNRIIAAFHLHLQGQLKSGLPIWRTTRRTHGHTSKLHSGSHTSIWMRRIQHLLLRLNYFSA